MRNLVSRRVRRCALGVAAIGAAFSMQAGDASASVAVCQPTDYMQDGHALTAAYVNPATVPENAEAADTLGQCDIGVYYNDGAAHSLADTNVFGARYYGILVNHAETSLTFSHGSAYDTGDKPHGGSQHGVDIGVRNGATAEIDNSQIFDYQKGGIVVDGTGSSATVLSNTVRGLGP